MDHVSPNDAKLEPMDLAKASGGRSGGGSRIAPKLPESGMSDEQKLAVGLIGELWAREWLRRRHNLESVDESMWVSRYRDAVLNTTAFFPGAATYSGTPRDLRDRTADTRG